MKYNEIKTGEFYRADIKNWISIYLKTQSGQVFMGNKNARAFCTYYDTEGRMDDEYVILDAIETLELLKGLSWPDRSTKLQDLLPGTRLKKLHPESQDRIYTVVDDKWEWTVKVFNRMPVVSEDGLLWMLEKELPVIVVGD